ncbi:TPA: LexA regulated protein, partial [Aeromonas veronii]
KTNPLPRETQLKINKRNQLKRDRENGLKRVELKVEAELLERLNQLALQQNISRAELIQSILKQQIESAFAVDIAV